MKNILKKIGLFFLCTLGFVGCPTEEDNYNSHRQDGSWVDKHDYHYVPRDGYSEIDGAGTQITYSYYEDGEMKTEIFQSGKIRYTNRNYRTRVTTVKTYDIDGSTEYVEYRDGY